MKAVFTRFLMIVMLAGVMLTPLKGVSFACTPQDGQLPLQLAAVELPQLTPDPPADHRFVLVPSAVPCLVAIAADAVRYEVSSPGNAVPAPVRACRLTGAIVIPSHGPPILS
jgi:hypothetical protein